MMKATKSATAMISLAFCIVCSLACALLFTACGTAGDTDKLTPENTAQLYADIYKTASETETMAELKTKEQIIGRFAEAGLTAVDCDNQINMVNWEQAESFCNKASAGEQGETSIYVINDDGSYTQHDLSFCDGQLHVVQQTVTGGEAPVITYQNEYDAAAWSWTEKGYLFFEAEHPTGDFGPWLETAIRIKPMDDDLRQAAQQYLYVLGYEDNNLFLEEWNETDFAGVDLYDIYEVLTGNISAENQSVAAAEFEEVIQRYLDISVSEIRSRTQYDAATNTYSFSSRTAEVKGSTPDMPYPEVAEITENEDGTVTLLVEAVWPKYKNDRAYVHEVVIRPVEGGSFKYVSNTPVELTLETSWYVGRDIEVK